MFIAFIAPQLLTHIMRFVMLDKIPIMLFDMCEDDISSKRVYVYIRHGLGIDPAPMDPTPYI